ncbi:TolC family protein [Rhabdobacter roseus]|uniref:Outer membrane protein TolC n=1 Tax=Rhabdobacter roseus TaxID=1655419 RepID=A0A840TQF3_9BACT|nr:TolC family protein [Rhabdobacter roseus]MBB5281979.1 outer membrane protein TolC [Rhabdobacter roseus]
MKRVSLLRNGLIGLALLLSMAPLKAQENSFSLQQAVDYALRQNLNIKNTQLDAVSAEARIGEIRAAGLPQVSANFSVTDNLIIQRVFLPPNAFGDPSVPADAPPVAIAFGVKYLGNAGATLNQLIFSGSYFVGLKAAATYRELAQKNVTQSKVTVADAVTKAYYSAQVAEERAKVLDLNIERLDTLMRETRALNESGFVERIDVDRLEVQLNNLKTERQNVQNLIELSYTLLKYQMGMPLDDPLTLTDKINDLNIESLRPVRREAADYDNRIEYSLLKTQNELAGLDIRNIRSGYLPVVSLSAGYGHNNGRDNLGDLFTTRWFNNAAITLNVQVPIFDGMTKHYQLQQARVTQNKVRQSQTLLEQSIDLEVRQANINLANAFATLETQRRNVDLAQEVVRVSKIKYKEGVGSNIEVINAESSFKEAQTNYFASLFDLLIANVDLRRAKGELYSEAGK